MVMLLPFANDEFIHRTRTGVITVFCHIVSPRHLVLTQFIWMSTVGRALGWLHCHAPQTAADLVMHKKKIDEIRGWMELQREPGLRCPAPRVLILNGAPLPPRFCPVLSLYILYVPNTFSIMPCPLLVYTVRPQYLLDYALPSPFYTVRPQCLLGYALPSPFVYRASQMPITR